jgi:hypothetical protein
MIGKDFLVGAIASVGIITTLAIGVASMNNNHITLKNTLVSTSIIGINSIIGMFAIA